MTMNTEIYYNSEDTICAISTPAGSGGVAMARVSGNDAIGIVEKIWHGKKIADMKSHTAHLGDVLDLNDANSVLDQAVLTIFRAPASFTGEDVIEISVHGSKWIQRKLIKSLIKAGARMALPGEFTRRAFASGKMDLAEAEAVADLIASSSAAGHRLAMTQMRGEFSKKIAALRADILELASLLELELDFSEEDVEFASREKLHDIASKSATTLRRLSQSFAAGRAIKDGVPVAILGKTNVGKSSLLNALIGDDRAIVSDIHGTTRDVVEDTVEIGPYLLRFMDTAGIRESSDPIEKMGIDRSRKAAQKAEIVLLVIDASNPSIEAVDIETIDPSRIITVINKTDLCSNIPTLPELPTGTMVKMSALNGDGIDGLKNTIISKLDAIGQTNAENDILVTNARHAEAFAAAAQALADVVTGLDSGISADFIAQDLRLAIHHLSAITGQISTPEILASIFSTFCIGK